MALVIAFFVRIFDYVLPVLYKICGTEDCYFTSDIAQEEQEEGNVSPILTEEKPSNFLTIPDGEMSQQPMKISSMSISYYPLNNSRIRRNDPSFYQLQKR